MRLHVFLSGLLVPIVSAAPALAAGKSVDEASPTERKEAGAIYADAMTEFDKNALEKALAGFRDSYRHVRSPNSHFMIARTLAKLGRNAEAYTELEAVIAEADALGSKYADTSRSASEKKDEIRPRIGLLTVQAAHAPKGTKYTVGGEAIDAERIVKPIAVLPGETKVGVTPPGGTERTWTKTLAAGESGTLEIDLAKAPESEKAEPPSHDKYLVEIELHVTGETLDPPGYATRGAGPGVRGSLPLGQTGLLGQGDSFAVTAGGDWLVTSFGHHAWIPAALQWNLWVLPELSVFFEPGVALMVGAGTYAYPVLDLGARYRVWRKMSVIGRVGIPGATLGVSMAL